MTIQPTSSHIPDTGASNNVHKPTPQRPQEQAPDTVQLSAQAKAASHAGHGDSH